MGQLQRETTGNALQTQFVNDVSNFEPIEVLTNKTSETELKILIVGIRSVSVNSLLLVERVINSARVSGVHGVILISDERKTELPASV